MKLLIRPALLAKSLQRGNIKYSLVFIVQAQGEITILGKRIKINWTKLLLGTMLLKASFGNINQGSLTEGEGSVQLTSLY